VDKSEREALLKRVMAYLDARKADGEKKDDPMLYSKVEFKPSPNATIDLDDILLCTVLCAEALERIETK